MSAICAEPTSECLGEASDESPFMAGKRPSRPEPAIDRNCPSPGHALGVRSAIGISRLDGTVWTSRLVHEEHAMGFSCRKFLIARDDTLWRLPTTIFQRMLREPANHCLSAFAGQRVRMADVVIELTAREPVRVVRATFSILTFDAKGRLDPWAFEKQQFALAESIVTPILAVPADVSKQPVVDASARFIAQGGQWVPSLALARAIDEAALGQRRCLRL